MVNSRVEPLEFLFINIPLTPPIGLEITLISITVHALEVFVMLPITFVKTLVELEFVIEIGTQFLSSVEHVKGTNTKPIEKIIDQLVATPLWPSVGVKPNTWKSWRFGVLRDSRMFRARQQGPKHLALRCSWCHWKRSWNVDIENGLRTFAAQVMGKRRAGSQTSSLTPDH